ncbi:glutamine amidotransferase, partial [mine drainage metagenome]
MGHLVSDRQSGIKAGRRAFPRPAGTMARTTVIWGAAVSWGMCRLFGMLAAEPQTAEQWLVRSDRSLLAQSNATPDTAQRDGWGIGWFEPQDRVRIEKGAGGAFEAAERPRFERAAADAKGTVVVGHLRHASNPLQLSREQLLGLENSQPFGTHTTLFAHNGMIPFPNETRPYLGVHAGEVKGV